MRFAVLDLGSTTFQILVTEAEEDGSLTPVLRDGVVLNLGMALAAAGGRIPSSVAERAVETVRRFRDLAERTGARRVLPVATSALRDAGNPRCCWTSAAGASRLRWPTSADCGGARASHSVRGE